MLSAALSLNPFSFASLNASPATYAPSVKFAVIPPPIKPDVSLPALVN